MKKNNMIKIVLMLSFLFVTIAISQSVIAATYISNSENWEDVYSVIQFAALNKSKSLFVTSEAHAKILPYDVPVTDEVKIISSKNDAYIGNYKNLLRSINIENVEEERLTDINFDLATQTTTNNFIVMDSAYSYNALALAPYARLTDSYVLFVNRNNLGKITTFLDSRGVDELLLYGTLQREVRQGLQKYDPEIINENGDKFLNNIEIVKKTLEIQDHGQALLTNGEFIEQELMISGQPVLFVGRNSVPPQVAEYIKSSTITVGVLVGNELINSGQTIRRETGISTIVKFGRGARVPDDAIMGEIEALDMFYLPAINIDMELNSIRYNKLTNKIQVTLQNNGDVAIFALGSYTIRFGTAGELVGDEDAVFIDSGEQKTFTYELEDRYADDNIFADVMILFGESQNSLEYLYEQKDVAVEIVEYDDSSTIMISDFYYDTGKNAFAIVVSNPGLVDAYVTGEIFDFYMNSETKILSSKNTIKVSSEDKNTIYIYEDLIDEDFVNNIDAKIRLYYGEQESTLINVLEEKWPLVKKSSYPVMQYAPYALLLLLVALIVTSNKKCKSCGKRNPKRRKTCKQCHAKLK